MKEKYLNKDLDNFIEEKGFFRKNILKILKKIDKNFIKRELEKEIIKNSYTYSQLVNNLIDIRKEK